MSEFKEQFDNDCAICPYCTAENHVEGENYSEDERTDECLVCGMKYTLMQNFTVTHSTIPDCELNGEKHKFEHYKEKYYICSICDKMVIK